MINRLDIYNRIATNLTTAYPSCYTTSRLEMIPQTFPTAYIRQIDAPENINACTLDGGDSQYECTFAVSIFTTDGMVTANAMMNNVNASMKAMGFRRTSQADVDNLTFYEITSRYTRFIGDGDTLPV